MAPPPRELLSAALRVKWERGPAEESHAVDLLANRAPGFGAEQYQEASQRAAALDGTAFELAAEWFAGRGQTAFPQEEQLESRHPGFAPADYAEAIKNNVLWARK
ncbi:MAG TPA: hypothetical protein VG826_34355 [Pirellulales bacterium]|nr:hypothetical protein [Pirellulales bacterium]